MEPFEFKVDENTVYIRIIRFLGGLVIGLTVSETLFIWKAGEAIKVWELINGLLYGLAFTLFPSHLYPTITIDEVGIHHINNKLRRKIHRLFAWDNISSIQVQKYKILINPKTGTSKKMWLPLYTKKQFKDLETYLQEAALSKNVEYLVE